MPSPYKVPYKADSVSYSGQKLIRQLLTESRCDRQGAFPVLVGEQHKEERPLAVPAGLTCLGPKVAGLLVYNTLVRQYELMSLVMDQRITHVAARNKAHTGMSITGNAITREVVLALGECDYDGSVSLGHCNVLYSGFGGFHIQPDPQDHPARGDLLLTLEDAILLRFKVVAPGTQKSVLFRQRNYQVTTGGFFEELPDTPSVNFGDTSSPLWSMAWSLLPHVAIAAHRRENNNILS